MSSTVIRQNDKIITLLTDILKEMRGCEDAVRKGKEKEEKVRRMPPLATNMKYGMQRRS